MGKRILVISPTPTHPTNAGNRIRIRRLVEALAGIGHEVHFLVAPREQSDPEAMRTWLGERFHLAAYRWPGRNESAAGKLLRWARQLVSVDARYLWNLDDWYDSGLDAEIERLQGEHRFDAVIVEYVFFSRALERFGPGVLKILDTHDCFTLRHRLYLETGLPPQFFSTTEAEEGRGLDRADLVLAIQDREREFFSRICHREVVTLGHLVTVERLFDPDLTPDGFDILFVGSANAINIRGVQAFVEEEWPLLLRRIPEARLLLAGAVCEAEIRGPRIERLGFVEDLPSVYRRARIVINPVRQSTGLNIKSIEALGFGMPLVSSPAGARGLDAVFGEALLVAGTPEEAIAAIERVRGDPNLASSLSVAGMAFARKWNEDALGRLAAILA